MKQPWASQCHSWPQSSCKQRVYGPQTLCPGHMSVSTEKNMNDDDNNGDDDGIDDDDGNANEVHVLNLSSKFN